MVYFGIDAVVEGIVEITQQKEDMVT